MARPRPLDQPRHCVFQGVAEGGTANAATLFAGCADCTALSRDLAPLQSSGCQPLGAWHCAMGFHDCRPQIIGAEQCISHFNRFLEQQGYLLTPPPATPSPLTTSPNAPPPAGRHRIEALFSTCLARNSSHWVAEHCQHSALAQTPSFVGNHSDGWDSMFAALASALKPGDLPIACGDSLNLVLGFEHFADNYRIMEQMLSGFGLRVQLLSDAAPVLSAAHLPRTNPRGTSLAELRAAPGARETLLVRPWALPKTRDLLRQRWGHTVPELPPPIGLAWSDAWLNYLAQLSGREVPAILQLQRHQLCEAIHRVLPLICRQRFAVYGEPDFVMGISRLLIELGAGPALILCQNGDKHWQQAMRALLTESGYEREVAVHIGNSPAPLTELLRRHPCDLLVAPPALRPEDHAPAGLPPSLRRVRLETPSAPGDRPSTLGYAGARHLLNVIVDAVMTPHRESGPD